MVAKSKSSTLAIHGGQPVRKSKMPARGGFADDEVASLLSAIEYYRANDQDPPYQGHFEKQYCEAFSDYMGGGFTDAVSSGTASVYVSLAAMELPPKSEVIISPVTDNGPLNCIIALGLVPVVADSLPDKYNLGVEQFLDRVTSNTSAAVVVHSGGDPLEIDRMVEEAHKRGIKVVEDVSQAPGAVWKGQKVGTFGDIAAFSTMYRKSLTSGGQGGLVFCKDLETHRKALCYADRGKQSWRTDINLDNPQFHLMPALNFNANELSCAIAMASLARLDDTIQKRVFVVTSLADLIRRDSEVCTPYDFNDGCSPFIFPIFVEADKISCTKTEFAEALLAEGVDLNPHYGCVISDWEYAKSYLSDDFLTTNALSIKERSFNLRMNEHYGETEIQDVATAILKVEKHFKL